MKIRLVAFLVDIMSSNAEKDLASTVYVVNKYQTFACYSSNLLVTNYI